jgi:hypothetical protein
MKDMLYVFFMMMMFFVLDAVLRSLHSIA